MSTPPAITVRWTIGNVSDEGFEALRLSVWGATKAFGLAATYVICINSMPLDGARERAGALPGAVEWLDVSNAMWPDLRRHVSPDMAEGVAWKFAPLRLDSARYELALDNDCILWSLPGAVSDAVRDRDACVIAEDVRPCFGQFAARCGSEPRNSGIRGIPASFDFGRAILDVLEEQPVTLRSELDEQGLQVAAMMRHGAVNVVPVSDVSICSPFPPHLPHLGKCGAHFVGLNARSLPWDLNDVPASDLTRAHWRTHRAALYDRVGLTLPDEGPHP